MKTRSMISLVPQPRRGRDIAAGIVRLIGSFAISPRIAGYLRIGDTAIVGVALSAAGRVDIYPCQTEQLLLEELRGDAVGIAQILGNYAADRPNTHRSRVVGADCRRVERNPQNRHLAEKGCRVAA